MKYYLACLLIFFSISLTGFCQSKTNIKFSKSGGFIIIDQLKENFEVPIIVYSYNQQNRKISSYPSRIAIPVDKITSFELTTRPRRQEEFTPGNRKVMKIYLDGHDTIKYYELVNLYHKELKTDIMDALFKEFRTVLDS